MSHEELESAIDLCGSGAGLARMLGYSLVYVSGLRNGRCQISKRFADALRSAIAEGRHLSPPEGGWTRQTGRPGAKSPMSIDELAQIIDRCGSLKATARKVGCSPAYLSQCRKGEGPVSQKISDALRHL